MSQNQKTTSVADLLAAVQKRSEIVEIQGMKTEIFTPSMNQICMLLKRFPALIELLDPEKLDGSEGNENTIMYLLKEFPEAVSAFNACVIGQAGNRDVEEQILSANDDFREEIFVYGVGLLNHEYETLTDFFTKLLRKMQGLGMENELKTMSRIWDSTSSMQETKPATKKRSPRKSKKTSTQKAA